jgi:hypothetical protein
MFTSLIAIASLAALGLANPVVKRDAPTDVNCGTTGESDTLRLRDFNAHKLR